jgi:hypothetical protein
MTEPIIVPNDQQPISAVGQSFDIYEWSGSGPDYLHVHWLRDLIAALHAAPYAQHNEIMRRFDSAIVV